MMRFVIFGILCLMFSCCADGGHIVTVGGLSESPHADTTVRRIHEEGLGTHTVLFRGPWNPHVLKKTLDYCRDNGMTLTMDEVMHRQNRGIKKEYRDSVSHIVSLLSEYDDVVRGSLFLGEFGGVNFSWPVSSVARGTDVMPAVRTFSEADSFVRERIAGQLRIADSLGLPRPFCSIEPMPGAIPHLLRHGVDRVDVEMIFGEDTELRYAFASGATKAFGKSSFGVDDAVLWYGGEQDDHLWFNRFRISLYHAYLRGADPIYAEHGIMNYNAFSKYMDENHPRVARFREILREFSDWVSAHPRPEGLPRASVAFMQGRLDGYAGGWQTHLWGQRGNEDFRVGYDELGWKMVEECYRREGWESRDVNGDRDFSGNPPLGAVDVVPYDAPDEVLAKYETVVFLGRNSMDDELYERLHRYVSGGGVLLMTTRHLNASDNPADGFVPYNGGDWRTLTGLRLAQKRRHMRFGLKFTAEPACGWKFHKYGRICDPWFTDGGFEMPVFENFGAEVLAVGSDRFLDAEYNYDETLLYENRIDKGSVIFCPAIDPVGSPQVYPLYRYLVRRALEADGQFPKVESSGDIRWACYEDGTVILLNTDLSLRQEVCLHSGPSSSRLFMLSPGEIKVVR